MTEAFAHSNKIINFGFWEKLPKPVFCLAPMEEVTDVVFREMFAKYSNPSVRIYSSHENGLEKEVRSKAMLEGKNLSGFFPLNQFVMFTEFINVDGILHPTGFGRLKIDLEYTESQRPIVAQIWGTDPEKFFKASRLIAGLGFDGVDINMGCPQDKEIGIGACAALIKNPRLAAEIIQAAKTGAGRLPVSVKTRIGYSKASEMENWISHLLGQNIAALTLHARTKQEKSKVPAKWEKIAEAVKIRDTLQVACDKSKKTLLIGNGDVKSRQEGLSRVYETGCDGVMIARGAFGNPWLFRQDGFLPTPKERIKVMLEHARLFEQKLGGRKSFYIMRKSFKAYLSGFEGAAELRAQLLQTKNLQETEGILEEFLKSF